MASKADDATATFAVDLESNAGEVAPNAAAAIEALREQIRGGVDELRNMQAALRNMKGASGAAGETVTALRDKIAAHKAVIGQQQARYIQLGGTFKNTKKPAQDAAVGIKELLEAARGSSGPLGGFAQRLGTIRSVLAAGGMAAGIVGVAAAVVALTAATVAAIGALTAYGIAQADARRSELLRLEGLSKTRNYWLAAAGFRQVADKASFLQGVVDQVSDTVALGREKIVDYASGLYRAGLRAGNLQAALEGVSIVAATQGDAAAEAWKGWALGAAMTGQSVRALANDVKARLGGIAARQLLSLDVQTRKLKENLTRIFAGVRLDKMLDGISKVTELFSQSTASGRALAVLAETMLNPIAEAIGSTGPIAKDFFRGMILMAQELVIRILETRLWFKKTFGDPEILKGIDKTRLALYVGGGVVAAFAGAVTALALGFAVMGLGAALTALSIKALVDGTRMAWAEMMKIDWAAAGTAVIDGIVNGIKAGINKVKAAVKSVGDTIQGVFSTRMMIR